MAIFDKIGSAIKVIGRAISGGFGVVLGGLGILGGRIIGLPGMFIDFVIYPIFGWRHEMDMRVRYIILADERVDNFFSRMTSLQPQRELLKFSRIALISMSEGKT